MPSSVRNKTYLRSDIYRVLRSLGQSNTRVVRLASSNETELYHAGYVSALIAVADAFGVEVTPELLRMEDAHHQSVEASTHMGQSHLKY